jgi:hypothetical protein
VARAAPRCVRMRGSLASFDSANALRLPLSARTSAGTWAGSRRCAPRGPPISSTPTP